MYKPEICLEVLKTFKTIYAKFGPFLSKKNMLNLKQWISNVTLVEHIFFEEVIFPVYFELLDK